MAIAIISGYTIALLGALFAYSLSKGKPNQIKMTIWGFFLMVPISEGLAYSLGVTVTYLMQDAWVQIAVWAVAFPILFVTGLVLLLLGKFKNKKEGSQQQNTRIK